ncbi:MAG: tRNA adenosine(34) deaminase TadA [Firmicutes bacterium]|nr:tRNA adenosine(34) deaminase TadA [Bacillota bacterium]
MAKVPVSPDEKYMREALRQAKKAMALGEVPIGAVIVYHGRIIGRGYNRRNTDHTTLSHAEITAIRRAGKVIGDWRLDGCTLYCTLEPCPMCAGAIEQARIDRVVIGARSDKSGCCGTLLNIVDNEKLMHQSEVTWDVLAPECQALIRQFFKDLRLRLKTPKDTTG